MTQEAVKVIREALEVASKRIEYLGLMLTPDSYAGINQRYYLPKLEKALSALDSIAGEWRGIETAPRDGSKIMLFISQGAGHILLGFWMSITPTEERKLSYLSDKKRTLMYKDGGYWSSHFNGEKPMRHKPTHWMPLPEPPKGEEE